GGGAPARHSRPMTVIMLTIGAGIALRGAALLVFGPDPLAMPMFTEGEPIAVGGATILWQTVWALVLCVLFFAALLLFFEKTYIGKAVQANVMNRFAARLYGIRPTALSFWVFVVSGAVSGLAGAVVAPITGATYDMGLMLGMKGFVAAVIGGLNNAAAAVVGAVLLGVVEALAAGLLSSGYADAISFVLLIAMLLLRPMGLWSRAEGKRV
uniref:branched-chain amino acid ABC transporter permease n=1 Tax=Calditerricola satsumensis TaxID=373054 RepID=UPI0012EE6602